MVVRIVEQKATAEVRTCVESRLVRSRAPNATGTISFTVFGPNNTTCTLPGTPGGSALVSGDGTYPSSAVPVVLAGTYRWIASYTGEGRKSTRLNSSHVPNSDADFCLASTTVTASDTPQATAGGTISVLFF